MREGERKGERGGEGRGGEERGDVTYFVFCRISVRAILSLSIFNRFGPTFGLSLRFLHNIYIQDQIQSTKNKSKEEKRSEGNNEKKKKRRRGEREEEEDIGGETKVPSHKFNLMLFFFEF